MPELIVFNDAQWRKDQISCTRVMLHIKMRSALFPTIGGLILGLLIVKLAINGSNNSWIIYGEGGEKMICNPMKVRGWGMTSRCQNLQ